MLYKMIKDVMELENFERDTLGDAEEWQVDAAATRKKE